jgi:matrixin
MRRLSPPRLTVHQLEDRLTPTWGVPWQDPGSLTLSFAPDGTDVNGHANCLFALLGADTAAWQTEILRAYQSWVVHTNLNVGLVADGGQALGVTGLAQGDSRFGDIRIAARPLSATASNYDMAATVGYDASGGTWSGDFLLSSLFSIGIGQTSTRYDLFSIALHEASHSFGFGDDPSDRSSVMYPGYTLWTGLTPRDITAIQSLYGVRSADPFEGAAGNGTTATAFDLTHDGNLTAFSADVTRMDDIDVYRFTTPSSSRITGLSINLRTAGISLLTARVTVLDEEGNVIASAVTTNPLANDLTIDLPNYQPDTTYYVKVQGARTDVFSIGAYALRLNYSEPYGNSFGLGSSYVNTESGPNDSLDTAMSLGFTNQTQTARFRVVGDISSPADVDWYRIAPTTLTSSTGTLTVGVLPLDANGPRLTVSVFNDQGVELPTVVVTNENGAFTVQLADQQPGQTYFLRVLAANPTGTRATGAYALAASLAPVDVTAFGQLTTGTLTADQHQLYSEMTVDRGKLTQFSLTATTGTGAPASAVRVTIINSLGQTVFSLVAEAGRALTTGTVWLSAGRYIVVYNAATRDGSALDGLTFGLSGRERSDPIDPYLEGPLGQSPPLPPPPPPSPPPPPPPPSPITVITIGGLVTIVPAGPINDPIADPYAGLGY